LWCGGVVWLGGGMRERKKFLQFAVGEKQKSR
jgi:hypothetical protein